MQTNRPKYLDLITLSRHLPMPGIISILHRISGLFAVAVLPIVLWLFDLSLSSSAGFDQVVDLLGSWWLKALALVLIWGLLHHICAGVRYLLIDLDIGVELHQARHSSMIVLMVSLTLTVVLGVWFLW